MQSLNQLVLAGKVLYLGASDLPAWVVSKSNEYARAHGLRQFSVYQGRWSAAERDFEREIIPMCQAEGMGFAPWGALGGGKFKTDEQRKAAEGRSTQFTGTPENSVKVSKVLESIAKKKDTLLTSVALAYVMHKAPYTFPSESISLLNSVFQSQKQSHLLWGQFNDQHQKLTLQFRSCWRQKG